MTEAEHQPYDRSSKWLIQHHGDSMLRLAGVKNTQAWRPAQAEVVQPRRLRMVLEVRLEDEPQDDLFLIEVATYPERRPTDDRRSLLVRSRRNGTSWNFGRFPQRNFYRRAM